MTYDLFEHAERVSPRHDPSPRIAAPRGPLSGLPHRPDLLNDIGLPPLPPPSTQALAERARAGTVSAPEPEASRSLGGWRDFFARFGWLRGPVLQRY